MKFTPKSSEEIALDGLLKEGKYPFTVTKAEDAKSKTTGAEMIKLQLTVYGDGTRQATVYDYLMESISDKLYKFCFLMGLDERYDSGDLKAEDCANKEGWAHIKIQPAKGAFKAGNVVSYYCQEPKDAAPARPRAAPPAAADLNDDEIPF